jgi:membrane-bound metal-dependent hydrolase YbcI (DUF457 family)
MKTRDHVIIAVLLYILSVQYLSEASEILLSPLFPVYCLLTIVGALFPDVDWKVAKILRGFGHRNPITHSLLIPILLLFIIHRFELSQTEVLAAYNAFTLGVASHLLGDLIKTGNLVWIPKQHEDAWFIVNGVILIALLYFTGFFKIF